MDSIFALSSGLPPAGIAVVRISGAGAGPALSSLTNKRLKPRTATLCHFVDPATGISLDQGLALWFPGPASVTGEDLAELHVHGGRAVVAAVLATLGRMEGLRLATAGEFTRRAFENGRIDLAEAEGLADLLAAETEGQRQSALALAEGALGRRVEDWQRRLLRLAAQIEAALDFSDEDDVSDAASHSDGLAALCTEINALLGEPPAERLKDGVTIVLAGPPNSGKSSLFNVIVGRDAAIVSAIAGTTRDRIEAPIVIDGIPLVLIDTAGLRGSAGDEIEDIGIARAGKALASADIILWLGAADACPDPARAILIAAKADLDGQSAGLAVSAKTGLGLDQLRAEMIARAKALLPKVGALALNQRHRTILGGVVHDLGEAQDAQDMLIVAEHVRLARLHLDALTGRAGVEDMLDALFGAFCIGK
ncbi:MAG: tRNA uridine-5-carboxymethylaminomethyl(34) synthesis GTPase MnmE [Chakrabartia sp.]